MKANVFALVASLAAFGAVTVHAEGRAARASAFSDFDFAARPISWGVAAPRYQPAPGYWQDVAVKVWVPARWTLGRNRWGGPVRVFEPAHFTFVTNRVWVEAGGRGSPAICRE